MPLNAIVYAIVLPISVATSVGISSDAQAAAPLRSMSSIMHVDQAPPAIDVQSIDIKNFHFSPMAIVISAGTTVTWKNLDSEQRSIISGELLFHSVNLNQNDVFTYKFDTPGTYKFWCSLHPVTMGTGTIIVR
jgi:plastocyanin